MLTASAGLLASLGLFFLKAGAFIAVSLGLLLWRKIREPVFVALGAIAGILLH